MDGASAFKERAQQRKAYPDLVGLANNIERPTINSFHPLAGFLYPLRVLPILIAIPALLSQVSHTHLPG